MRSRFILTSGFISSVKFIISLYAKRLRGRPSLPLCVQQCLPPLSSPSLQAHIFISSLFEWLNYSDMCKWVVFIFLPGKWKLKVTWYDLHLLLKLNCSECAVWIIVAMRGFVNRRAMTLAPQRSIWSTVKGSLLQPTLPAFIRPLFEYSSQNKGNHVRHTGLGQGPTLSRATSLDFEDPLGASKFPTHMEEMNLLTCFQSLSI